MLTFAKKKAIIFLFSIIGTFRDSKFWSPFYVSGVQKDIDTAIESIERVCAEICTGKDCDDLARDIKRGVYRIECLHSNEIADRHKKIRGETITLKRGDYEDMLEILLEPCSGCDRSVKACSLRNILKRMKVEPLDPDKQNKCEYCISRKI